MALLATVRLVLYRFVTSMPELLIAPVPERQRLRVTQVMLFAISAFVFCVIVGRFVPPLLVLAIYGLTPVAFVTLIIRVQRA